MRIKKIENTICQMNKQIKVLNMLSKENFKLHFPITTYADLLDLENRLLANKDFYNFFVSKVIPYAFL